MKKFIKALEDAGIMKKMVNSACKVEKMTGEPIKQRGMEMILELELARNEELLEIFFEETNEIAMKSIFKYLQKQILERQKTESLEEVDVDSLLEKALGKTSSKEESKKKLSVDDVSLIVTTVAKVFGLEPTNK